MTKKENNLLGIQKAIISIQKTLNDNRKYSINIDQGRLFKSRLTLIPDENLTTEFISLLQKICSAVKFGKIIH